MKFSIITMTHNRADLIGETIESVLNQTHQNFEHIIIDDGSTDDTEKIVKHYINKSNNKIIYIKKNRIGVLSILRNIGLKVATGDIISILDSDDLFEHNKLELINSIFENNTEVNFVFHDFKYFNNIKIEKHSYFKYNNNFIKNVFREILLSEILSFSVYSFRKTILKDVGYFDETMYDGQHDYYARIAYKYDFFYLNKTLSYIRRHNENMSKISDVNHCFDAIKTFKSLKRNNQIGNKLYKEAIYLMNYKIAKFYNENNSQLKRNYYLKKVLKQAPILSKVFVKSFLFKISIFKKL